MPGWSLRISAIMGRQIATFHLIIKPGVMSEMEITRLPGTGRTVKPYTV
jgi:hypothetical protein